MKARIASSIVVAVAILIGTAGCDLVQPQATTTDYLASNGVDADLGDIAVRNAVVITDKGVLGNLVMTVVNSSSERARFTVQHGGDKDVTVSVPPSSTTVFGYPDGDTVLLRGIDTQPGALIPIYFQTGDDEGKEVLVPVLNGGLPEYKDLLPVDVATAD